MAINVPSFISCIYIFSLHIYMKFFKKALKTEIIITIREPALWL